MSKPFSTRGGCVPVVHSDHLLVHTCRRPVGGDKTIGAPQYSLTVTNGGVVEDLFQDELGNVVVDDALDALILNS
jgi:hypothetical protein